MYHYQVLSVDRVIDGDTVEVTLDLGFSLFTKQKVRVLGINTPELKSKDPLEKARALEARRHAEKWFASGNFTVHTMKDDKYGRILGDFEKEGEELTFSESVLRGGFGIVYNG